MYEGRMKRPKQLKTSKQTRNQIAEGLFLFIKKKPGHYYVITLKKIKVFKNKKMCLF